MDQKNASEKHLSKSSVKRFNRSIFILSILLVLIILVGLYFMGKFKKIENLPTNNKHLNDTLDKRIDKNSKNSTDSLPHPDTTARKTSDSSEFKRNIPRKIPKAIDSSKATRPQDSAIVPLDSTLLALNPCLQDTTPAWIYPDPSGGQHYGSLSVKFFSTKPCSIWWRIEGDSLWNTYNNSPVSISETSTIQFFGKDSCNRQIEARSEYYEIVKEQRSRYCPKDMEYVKIGDTRFCIDRYEWPNKKGEQPISFVSLYNAQDSCFMVDKRLCTSEEWMLACSGPYGYRYPYGDSYEPYACATHDSTTRVSGSKVECRSFFGTFDMSGNLMEWTSTPSNKNRNFTTIMGGFFESGPQSGCKDTRYGYFPQNRHNPIGFRCCKDAAQLPVEKSGYNGGK